MKNNHSRFFQGFIMALRNFVQELNPLDRIALPCPMINQSSPHKNIYHTHLIQNQLFHFYIFGSVNFSDIPFKLFKFPCQKYIKYTLLQNMRGKWFRAPPPLVHLRTDDVTVIFYIILKGMVWTFQFALNFSKIF